MQYWNDVLTEVTERLHAALKVAARRLHAGQQIKCSLALLPAVALKEMSLTWGMVEWIPQKEDVYELAVGVGEEVMMESFAALFNKLQEQHGVVTDRGKSTVPLIGPLVKKLEQEKGVVMLMLLFFPAHSALWNERRRWLKSIVFANDVSEKRDDSLLLSVLLQEFILTSLLLSCHYKKQEVWVHRWWVVRHILSLGGIMNLQDFHMHDRSVLLEAADKHPMNYNAWNYRRQVFLFLFDREGVKNTFLLQQELNDVVVPFFERHNGDTSVVSYLIFLLEQATARQNGTSENDVSDSVAVHVWRRLLSVTTRELRRHYDKGHEAVWVLRLVLMRWALCHRPLCGWTLQDELEFVSVYASLAEEDVGKGRLEVTWVDVSGSCWWTSYHALRYGLQLVSTLKA